MFVSRTKFARHWPDIAIYASLNPVCGFYEFGEQTEHVLYVFKTRMIEAQETKKKKRAWQRTTVRATRQGQAMSVKANHKCCTPERAEL